MDATVDTISTRTPRCVAAPGWALAFACTLALALALAPPARAVNDGDIDTTFGTGGQIVLDVATGTDAAYESRVSIGPSQEISLGYTLFSNGAAGNDFAACRLTSGGAVITCNNFGFDLGGSNADTNEAIATRIDGTRLLAGRAQVASGYEAACLSLDVTNVVDAGFGGGDGKRTYAPFAFPVIEGLALRYDGSAILVGDFDHEPQVPGSGYDCLVGRIADDGSPDTGFDTDGWQSVGWDFGGNDDFCYSAAVFPDGDVVVAGSANTASDGNDFAIARFTSAGAPDNGFSGNGRRLVGFDLAGSHTDSASRVAVDPQERIVVAGVVEGASASEVGVARLLPNGDLDGSFNGTGTLHFTIGDGIARVSGLAILPPPSKDIVVSGIYTVTAGSLRLAFVAMLHDGGTFDTSFATTGKKLFAITGQPNVISNAALGVQGGELVLSGGFGESSGADDKIWSVRLYRSAIFGDDFESHDMRLWSDHADPL